MENPDSLELGKTSSPVLSHEHPPPKGRRIENAGLRLRLRRILSLAPYFGLPPPATFRPPGVSAMLIAKNEAEWAETSVLSILNFVDEVVVADHGSEDGTGEILESVERARPGSIRLLKFTAEPFHDALNTMVSHCKYSWILRFNLDFIARTSGPSSIANLVAVLRRLDRARYFCISLSGIALDGDLHHQFPNRRDPYEPLVFTYSPWLRYGVSGRWETLHVPWFYEKIALPDSYYFHMRSVKSRRRMLQKLYWSHWYDARNKGSTISLRDFIDSYARLEWGGSSDEEAAKNYVLAEFAGCIPFSREICGEYPDILLPALKQPPFELVFLDGRLTDRVESDRYRPQSTPGDPK